MLVLWVTQLSWAAAGSAIAIVMTVRWLLGIPRARADVRRYRERFAQAHAEHEAAFFRFFAAEQAGTADVEPGPSTPPTVRCPVCGGLVTVAHVQVCRAAGGMLIAARELLDRDRAVLADWTERERRALAGQGCDPPQPLATGSPARELARRAGATKR